MKRNVAALGFLLTFTAASPAAAADIYASPSGNGDGSSESSPTSLISAVSQAQAGDTVYLLSGTYSGLRPSRSGTASAWITFSAAPGALPIIEGGNVGSGDVQYIRYVGIVARNGSSGGFGNGWTNGDCAPMSNGNLEYINCVAEGNGINGIAHYCAGGLRIKQCIVAHNGNRDPSWSGGMCTSVCAEGLTQCGQACVDLATSLLNCGACQRACLTGQTCQNRQCQGTATGDALTVPTPTPATPASPGMSMEVVEESDGCGCSAVGSGRSGLGTALLAMMGLLVLGRRGKRS